MKLTLDLTKTCRTAILKKKIYIYKDLSLPLIVNALKIDSERF